MTGNWQKRLSDIKRLDRGRHTPGSGRMSIIDATAMVAGEDHASRPKCLSPTIGGFADAVNDLTTEEERKALIVAIPMMLGSNDPKTERRRGHALAMKALTIWAPESLRKAGWQDYALEMETAEDEEHAAHKAQTLLARLNAATKSKKIRYAPDAEEILTICTLIATGADGAGEDFPTSSDDEYMTDVRWTGAKLAGELAAKACAESPDGKRTGETALSHEALRTIRELRDNL